MKIVSSEVYNENVKIMFILQWNFLVEYTFYHFILTERQGSREHNLGTLFWISILVRGSRLISQTLFIFQTDTGKTHFHCQCSGVKFTCTEVQNS